MDNGLLEVGRESILANPNLFPDAELVVLAIAAVKIDLSSQVEHFTLFHFQEALSAV